MNGQDWHSIAESIAGGLVSGIALIASMKTDITWLKRELFALTERVFQLEKDAKK